MQKLSPTPITVIELFQKWLKPSVKGLGCVFRQEADVFEELDLQQKEVVSGLWLIKMRKGLKNSSVHLISFQGFL